MAAAATLRWKPSCHFDRRQEKWLRAHCTRLDRRPVYVKAILNRWPGRLSTLGPSLPVRHANRVATEAAESR
jgi:hypothetical protein